MLKVVFVCPYIYVVVCFDFPPTYLCHPQVVFFQGVCPRLRKEVWPFLLQLYSFESTQRERTRIRLKRSDEYSSIDTRRSAQQAYTVYIYSSQEIDQNAHNNIRGRLSH